MALPSTARSFFYTLIRHVYAINSIHHYLIEQNTQVAYLCVMFRSKMLPAVISGRTCYGVIISPLS